MNQKSLRFLTVLAILLFCCTAASATAAIDYYLVVGDNSPAQDVMTITELSSELSQQGMTFAPGKLNSEVIRADLENRVTVVLDHNKAVIIVGSTSPAEQVVHAVGIAHWLDDEKAIPSKSKVSSEITSDDLLLALSDVPDQELECKDSDGGENIYEAGEAFSSDGRGQADLCVFGKDNVVQEAICDNGIIQTKEITCPSHAPYCYKAMCSTNPQTCEDTDKGNNIEIQGTVTESRIADSTGHTDYCEDINTFAYLEEGCSGSSCGVREFFCAGSNMAYTDTPCPEGCNEGNCKKIIPISIAHYPDLRIEAIGARVTQKNQLKGTIEVRNVGSEIVKCESNCKHGSDIPITFYSTQLDPANSRKDGKGGRVFEFWSAPIETGRTVSFEVYLIPPTGEAIFEGFAGYLHETQSYVTNEQELRLNNNYLSYDISGYSYLATGGQPPDQPIPSPIVPDFYSTVKVECYDGKTDILGGDGSCKPSENWKHYAQEFCKDHCKDEKCGVNSFSVGELCKGTSAPAVPYPTPVPPQPVPYPVPVQPQPVPPSVPEPVCNGCVNNGICLPFGSRLVENNQNVYCGFEKSLLPQKDLDQSCQNNYECSTNQCIDGICANLREELQETRSLLERVLSWFNKIFG